MESIESNNSQLKRKVIIKFAIFIVGIFLNYSGYIVLLNLQSSINIEDGVGTISVMITYITAAIFGVFVTPFILRYIGPKTCLIFCEITFFLYIVANYYPAYYTLIPAGVFVGMGEATLWPVMMLFCVHYARWFARFGTKDSERCIAEFIGIFYCIYQFSGVFGNLLSYAILYSGKSIPQQFDNTSTPSPPVSRDLSICGKNDCQLPNVTNENINNYVPASQTLLYILIGVMAGLVLLAIFIHFFFVKNVDASLEVSPANNNDVTEEKVENSTNQTNSSLIVSSIKATFLHMINPKQLLITPLALYSGLLTTFAFTELSRSFASCMFGVEQVGLLAALGGSADALMSFVSGKIASRYGRNVAYFIGFCLDIGNYMIVLFWVPTESSLWVAYIIFVLVGSIDGIWQPLVNEMHGAYFPENEDIAFAVWNMYTLVGVAWQAGWSTSLCVYEKVYFMIAFLCFSIICYIISQIVYYSKKPLTQSDQKNSSTKHGTYL